MDRNCWPMIGRGLAIQYERWTEYQYIASKAHMRNKGNHTRNLRQTIDDMAAFLDATNSKYKIEFRPDPNNKSNRRGSHRDQYRLGLRHGGAINKASERSDEFWGRVFGLSDWSRGDLKGIAAYEGVDTHADEIKDTAQYLRKSA